VKLAEVAEVPAEFSGFVELNTGAAEHPASDGP
jgi:hypothetical protein